MATIITNNNTNQLLSIVTVSHWLPVRQSVIGFRHCLAINCPSGLVWVVTGLGQLLSVRRQLGHRHCLVWLNWVRPSGLGLVFVIVWVLVRPGSVNSTTIGSLGWSVRWVTGSVRLSGLGQSLGWVNTGSLSFVGSLGHCPTGLGQVRLHH